MTYEPGDGRRQNVHTKRWEDAGAEKIEARKSVGLTSGYDKARYPVNPETGERYIDHELVITDKQFGKKLGEHAVDYGLNPKDKAGREAFRAIVNDIARNADERVYGDFKGQTPPVLFHIKGNDVVLENKDGEFISIFRGGASNAWIMHFRNGEV